MTTQPPKKNWREQYKQFRASHQRFQEVDSHIRRNKEAYLIGAGILVGILGLRLIGHQSHAPVVVYNIINTGAAT